MQSTSTLPTSLAIRGGDVGGGGGGSILSSSSSSIAASRPFIFAEPPTSVVPSAAPSSRPSSHHRHRRPTWMNFAATNNYRQSSPPTPTQMSSSQMNNATNTTSASDSTMHHPATSESANELAPTFVSPREASLAYQCGLLKSLDSSTITSKYGDCHSKMRLAIRYLTTTTTTGKQTIQKNDDAVDDDDDDDDEEDLFLCFIDEHGMPFHFRRIRARTAGDAASSATTTDRHGNDDAQHNVTTATTAPSSSATTPSVDEWDHIERTYPGHAFVFCRKINNVHLDVENYDGGGDGTLLKADAANGGGRGHDASAVVIHCDGMTYFLHKRRKNKKRRDCNHDGRNADCYLVVGGFRPGQTPKPMKLEDDEDEIHSDDGDDEEDEEDNDDDLYVQLVTITRLSARINANADDVFMSTDDAITKSHHRTAATPKRERDTDADENDDDNPTPSWKLLFCSCFPRMANTRFRRIPAFLTTSANSHLDQYGNQITTNKITEVGEWKLDIKVSLSRLDPTPIDTSSKQYDTVLLGGWPCRIEPGCFPSNMTNPTTGLNVLQSRFESDILAASASLPPHARESLKKTTPIWINKSSCYGPRASPIVDRDGCFHPGTEWLIKNGMNPDKCGGVEWYDAQHYLSDCDLWGPGGLMLHELSHAWHCLHIENGYDNEEIIDVYNSAMEEGLYDCVRVHDLHGRTRECKAYACNNPMEYFAELSVAFLGGVDTDREHNKWFPFNRRQVQEHDPRAFAMLCRMWGVVADEGVN